MVHFEALHRRAFFVNGKVARDSNVVVKHAAIVPSKLYGLNGLGL